MISSFRTSASEIGGGRVFLLLLLFALAIYEFFHAGFSTFATVCLLPVLALVVILAFRYQRAVFWFLIILNYFIMWQVMPIPAGIPVSLYNEMLEIILIAFLIIDVKDTKYERVGNIMFFSLVAWCGFCTLEVLNDTCGLGIDVASWYAGVRLISFQLLYACVVFMLYITDSKILIKYLYLWGALALFAVFWVWKQKNIGLTPGERSWLYGSAGRQHLIQGGSLIRYWSIYTDAANFGVGMASTAVAFIIFGINSKIWKHRIFFLIVGFACAWAMFPTGTRTAIFCFIAGFMVYIFLSKSFKIAIPVTIVFAIFVFILAFTKIGQGNQQIRRMRSAFDRNDASSNTRDINQAAMKKYLAEAPWGIGLGGKNVPANNKYNHLNSLPPDSEYVYIWIHTGVIGISTFLICTVLMIFGACWIVFFTLKSPSLRGIGAGFCCAMVSQQLGGYGNQVLMQFPNCLTFYGGLAIVYILPYIEKEWMEYEQKQLALQEEKKRLRLEKKKASRV